MPEKSKKTAEGAEKATGSLERGLRILEVLRSATASMPLKQIAAEIGCDPSTTLRLLRTLVQTEYVLRDTGSKHYLPASKALMPLSLYHSLNGFRQDAYSEISKMREETGLSIAVVLFLRLTRLVVEMKYGSERLSPYYDTHLKRPIHSSATGKILLAAAQRHRWEELLGEEPYEAFTDRTRTTAEQLAADIETFESTGYASTIDESVVGLSAVAAPLRNSRGEIVGCIGAFGHTTGLARPEQHDAIGKRAIRAATLLSQTSATLNGLNGLVGIGGGND